MGQIKELTKNTLSKLKEDNKSTLPSNYFIEFKKQADLLKSLNYLIKSKIT